MPDDMSDFVEICGLDQVEEAAYRKLAALIEANQFDEARKLVGLLKDVSIV